MPTAEFNYRARHINEDPVTPFSITSTVVGGTNVLDAPDGDNGYIEVDTPVGHLPYINTTKGTLRWELVGTTPAPPMTEWVEAFIYIGTKTTFYTPGVNPTLSLKNSDGQWGVHYGVAYSGKPDVASADGYTIRATRLWGSDFDPLPDGFDLLASDAYFIMGMTGDNDGGTARFTSVSMTIVANVVAEPEPPEEEVPAVPLQRTHIHLPITKSNGDLYPYVDVTLWHEDGTLLTTPVYDGPNPANTEITWPVTYAPSIVDLWIDEVARLELHLEGPEGYSSVIRAVDFLPAPNEQVQTGQSVRVTSVVQPDHWLRVEGGQVRWLNPGMIAAHTHDGGTANSTLLESVDSDEDHTLLGKGVTAGGTGSTVVGALSTTTGANATVVGPDSDAAAGAVLLGDASGSGQPADAVWLPYGALGVLDALVDSDSVVLRQMAVESAAAQIGTAGTVGTGVTNPVWVLGNAKTENLDAQGDVVLGDATSTLAFFDGEGAPRATRPAGATDALASLLDALEAYGLIVP